MPFDWTTDSFIDANGQAKTVVGTIYDAINERMAAVGETPMPALIPGQTMVHSSSETKPGVGTEHLRWAFFQKWCEENCGEFVQTYAEDGTPLDFHNVTEINFWTWPKIKNTVLSAGEWTAIDSTGAGVERRAQAGDRYGPWLMQELRDVLNLLTMTAKTATWSGYTRTDGTNAYNDTTTPVPGDPTLAFNNYIAGGAAEWASASLSALGAVSPTSRWQVNGRTSSSRYSFQGNVTRSYATASVTGLATTSKDISFVVNTAGFDHFPGAGTTLDYQTSGDPVIENKWSRWVSTYTSETGSSKTTHTTLGGDTLPLSTGSTPVASPAYVTPSATSTFNRGCSGWALTTNTTATPDHQLTDAGSLGTLGASVALIDWTGFAYR
jgi:hypothetical protein